MSLEKQLKDKWGVSNSYMAIGLYYQSHNVFDSAYYYLKNGLALSEELGDEEMMAIGCYNLANVYQKQNKMPECIALYLRSLDLAKKNNNLEGIATCLEALGQIAFEKGETAKAIKMFEEAFEKATANNNKELIQSIAERLSPVYEITGNFKKALFYHKIWVSVKDSLHNQENTRKLTSEMLQFEHEKEKIILQKEQEKKEAIAKSEAFKKDLILIASILFLIVVSIFSFIIF